MNSPDGSFSEQLKALTIEWEQAQQKTQAVRRQFVTSGSLTPGGQIAWPERILDTQGLLEIDEAERVEKEAWDALQEFVSNRRPT